MVAEKSGDDYYTSLLSSSTCTLVEVFSTNYRFQLCLCSKIPNMIPRCDFINQITVVEMFNAHPCIPHRKRTVYHILHSILPKYHFKTFIVCVMYNILKSFINFQSLLYHSTFHSWTIVGKHYIDHGLIEPCG